jgi:hypothetical protein
VNDRPYLELPIPPPMPLFEDPEQPYTRERIPACEEEEESKERVVIIQL